MWNNGGGTTSTTGQSSTTLSSLATDNYLWIGGVSGYYPAPYSIGEILEYNIALSTTQRQNVEGYLAWKWGLPGQLPSSHPYKNAPPGLNIPVVPQNRQLGNRIFQPTKLAGCSVWMDAADPSTFTLSGTSISQWRDKAASRTYSGSSTYARVNSYPSVQFNGAQTMTTTTTLSFSEVCTTAANFTCCLVLYVNSSTAVNSSPFSIGSASSRFMPFYNGTGGLFFDAAAQANPRLSGCTFTNNTLQIHVFNRNTVVNLLFRLNGSVNTSNTYVTPGSFANETYTGYMSTSGAFFTGNLCEAVYYNNDIGTGGIQQVEGYLAWKWGLQGSLPGNHPFKRWPPPP